MELLWDVDTGVGGTEVDRDGQSRMCDRSRGGVLLLLSVLGLVCSALTASDYRCAAC